MERVYPRLREYGNRRGINLEITDPWWGMDESGLEEHVDQRLLKSTITRCLKSARLLGRHAYFVASSAALGFHIHALIFYRLF